ncbi:hypothetical protein Tco_1114152 [Tanacetum coccineum]|uniref:Uncharacterized protein n=1 Tax=Tanacetum coccineum TaxID=301880 RepID=A0ABQ5IUG5_9ASTR
MGLVSSGNCDGVDSFKFSTISSCSLLTFEGGSLLNDHNSLRLVIHDPFVPTSSPPPQRGFDFFSGALVGVVRGCEKLASTEELEGYLLAADKVAPTMRGYCECYLQKSDKHTGHVWGAILVVIHEGETLAEVKVRIQKKLEVSDEEFSKCMHIVAQLRSYAIELLS